MRFALGLDLLSPAAWQISERGLVAEVRPVWAGVRDYDGRREFRDPAQLKSAGFARTLERLPLVIGHPRDAAGRVVFLGATAPREGEALPFSEEGAAYPHSLYQVGTLGDAIAWDQVEGIEVPRQRATVTAPHAIARVAGIGCAPAPEVSLGFIKVTIEEPGEWVSPSGERLPYDFVQIVDPDDPRVPEVMRPWVGANYLGIGFTAGQSRGGYTAMSPLGADARPEGRKAPRVFHLIRQGDETGISGVGHVLDGVVWPDGQVVTKWCVPGKPSEINVSKSFDEWQAIHVNAHPTNKSLVIFDDTIGADPYPNEHAARQLDPEVYKVVGSKEAAPGVRLLFAKKNPDDAKEPSKVQAVRFDRQKFTADEARKWLKDHDYKADDFEAASPPATDSEEGAPPSSTSTPPPPSEEHKMSPEEMQKMIDELKMQLAAKDKMIAELNAKLGGMSEDMAKKAAACDAKVAEVAKLEAELAPIRKVAREKRAAEVAKIAGIDAKDLDGADDLEVAAMKVRFSKGLDAKPAAEYLDNPVYLRARFDGLPTVAPSTPTVSPAFAHAVGGDAQAAPVKPVNKLAALP